MSGIFISYADEDRERAKVLAQTLEQRGWPVWWDRMIPLGKTFDEVIAENLARAQCVLVLWTKASVASRWVRAEASEAAARGVLIPVLLEPELKIPLAFKLLQAAKLADWDGAVEHAEFQTLLANVEAMLNASPAAVTAATPSNSSTTPPLGPLESEAAERPMAELAEAGGARATSTKLRHALLFIAFPTALIVGAAVALMNWRVSTSVQLDLVVDRLVFTVTGADPVDLPERPLDFRTLSVENFDQVKFEPQRLMVVDQAATQPARPPASGEASLMGIAGERSVLTIARVGEGRAGRMESIPVKPGSKVILETGAANTRSLTLRVDGQDLHSSVLPTGELELSIANASLASAQGTVQAAVGKPLLLRVTLRPDAPYIRIQSARRPFVISATLEGEGPALLAERMAITDVEFLKQDARGSVESSVVSGGRIGYEDYPTVAPILLRSRDLIGVGDFRGASLAGLTLNPGKQGFELHLEGMAGRIETVSGGTKRDRRLTVFDTLWNGARTTVLFLVLAWAVSICVGAYRLYKDLGSGRSGER